MQLQYLELCTAACIRCGSAEAAINGSPVWPTTDRCLCQRTEKFIGL